MPNNGPPSRREINPCPGDLDGDYAEKNWLGKSINDGVEMLRTNALHYGEDFMYMGPTAFAYYMESAVRYALSQESSEDSDFASAFFDRIEFRFSEDAKAMACAREVCCELAGVIIQEYAIFDIDESIYEKLSKEQRQISFFLTSNT